MFVAVLSRYRKVMHDLEYGTTCKCVLTLQVQGRPPARPLDWADLTLPYFNAVVKESMRIHPVGATGTMRCVHRTLGCAAKGRATGCNATSAEVLAL